MESRVDLRGVSAAAPSPLTVTTLIAADMRAAALCSCRTSDLPVRTGRIRRALDAGVRPHRARGKGPAAVPAGRTLALVNGQWLRDGRFVASARYVVNGTLRDYAPGAVDSTIDLHAGFVIPPFGEAHNHNVEGSERVDAVISRYLHDGVFYVENPNVLPRDRTALSGKVSVPTGVDVVFANGGLTSAGGHPIEIVRRNITRFACTDSIALWMKDGKLLRTTLRD